MSPIAEKVLMVDDNPKVLAVYERQFSSVIDVKFAESAQKALELFESEGNFSLLVTDYQLPEMTGLELIHKVREISPSTVTMVLTGYADLDLAMKAINECRVFKFLAKPCNTKVLAAAMIDGLRESRRLAITDQQNLDGILTGTIQILTEMIMVANEKSFRKGRRVQHYAKELAKFLGIDDHVSFETAALFSLLGHIGFSDELNEKLASKAPLNEYEAQLISSAPETAENLLSHIPKFAPIAKIVRYSNKNFDGSGFPIDDVKGESIPFESRVLKILYDIVHLADTYDDFSSIHELLRQNPEKYDSQLLEEVFRGLDKLGLKSSEVARVVRKVNISEFKMGDILLSDVETIEGKLLFSSGKIVTKEIMKKLYQFANVTPVKEPIVISRESFLAL